MSASRPAPEAAAAAQRPQPHVRRPAAHHRGRRARFPRCGGRGREPGREDRAGDPAGARRVRGGAEQYSRIRPGRAARSIRARCARRARRRRRPTPAAPPRPPERVNPASRRSVRRAAGGRSAPTATTRSELVEPARSRRGIMAVLLTLFVIIGIGITAYVLRDRIAALTGAMRGLAPTAQRDTDPVAAEDSRSGRPGWAAEQPRRVPGSRRTPRSSSCPRSRNASCCTRRIRPTRPASASSARRSGAPKP